METLFLVLKVLIITVLAFVVLYLLVRTFSLAAFKSWLEVKEQHEHHKKTQIEGGELNGNSPREDERKFKKASSGESL